MRLLFLTHRPATPSTQWRVTDLLPALRAIGADAQAEPVERSLLARRRQFKSAAGFDVVVLQKRLLSGLSLGRLRRSAKRLIFEFDDAIPFRRVGDRVVPTRLRGRRFARTVSACDAVTTSNDYLAGLARAHLDGRPIGVFPNFIDASRWTPRADAGAGLVVGWNGTTGNHPYLDAVVPALRGLAKRRPGLRLRLLTDSPYHADGVRVEVRPFRRETEPDEIRAFEIGIAPMPDDDWTRGKCPLKILTYFASGVPVVASESPAHRIFIRDGENGLIARPDGWEEALERLISDASLRARLASAGRRSSETEFDVRATASRMLEFYGRVSSG